MMIMVAVMIVFKLAFFSKHIRSIEPSSPNKRGFAAGKDALNRTVTQNEPLT